MNFDDVPKPFVFIDGALFDSHFAKTVVVSFTKKYYENLFCEKLIVGEEIDVPIGWIPKKGNVKIKVVCPRCNESRETLICNLTRYGHTFCFSCMMKKKYDNMIGESFGKLVVLRYGNGVKERSGIVRTTFVCKCDCGKEIETRASGLKMGTTNSCGCQRIEMITGENNYCYNHNLTDEQRYKLKKQRKDSETQKVKKIVRKRDKNTCWFCGSHGFIVHHLNDFANHPEGRTDVNNLVCVCSKCHNDFHKWSGGTKALTTTLHNYLYKYYIMSLDRTLDK